MPLRVWLLLVLFGLLETTVTPFLRLFGVAPNLILLLTSAVALYRGSEAGFAVGVVGGFILDAWRGQALGLFALASGLTGYLLGLMERRLFKDNLFVPLAAGFTGTLIFQAVFLVVGSFLGLRFALWPALTRVALPEALYNALLAPLVFRLTANLLGGGQSQVTGKDNA
ncbi:MAG: rod shape-determining protein MreD [Chitinophagales bacterium]